MNKVSQGSRLGRRVDGVERELLETWPDRFRFPDVLVALVRQPASADYPGDGTTLARSVLACVDGRPPRAVCETLVERGEFDAAEYALAGCPDLSGHDAESLTRKLEAARVAAEEAIRQRVSALERRAAAGGVTFNPPEVDVLDSLARSRTAAAEAVLDAATAKLDDLVGLVAQELDERLNQQAAGITAGNSGHSIERVKALAAAGELVAAQALLNREPLGMPIPEGVPSPPRWNEEWCPKSFLEYHLNPAQRRPPEFSAWEAADHSGTELLIAYDRVAREPSAEAAEAFADAFSRFLGAPGGGAMAQKVKDRPFHLTFFDGLFGTEALSRLHPTGRVDLYVGGPGATVVPELAEGQAPHVAVGPGLEPADYTDRRVTAVLSLRDLLRLVVLSGDRAAAALNILARQWPVTALAGDSAAALAGVLGDEPDAAWHTLRWVAHLSLGVGPAAVQAMENCTGMDPALLRVMLEYAEHRAAVAPTELWDVVADGWQRDEVLVHALREDLMGRCGGPSAEAAWWAALAVCDPDSGHVTREDVGVLTEACSAWPRAKDEVLAGVDALVARELLVSVGEGNAGNLQLRPSGVARALRVGAEQQLTVLLERLEHARGELLADPVAVTDERGAPRLWTAWHRNRFATVPAHARYAEAEAQGVDGGQLAAIVAEAEAELYAQADEALIDIWPRPDTEVAQLLHALGAQCEDQYPEVRLDMRCPPGLHVDVPKPVLRAVLYEVLDNAAEALAAEGGGMIQISAKSESPEVLVEVQDSGPGLPAEAHRGRRIFLPSWTTRGEGRGGGLYRARRFLRAFATPSVETDAVVFESAHPTLTGAALRLVLPEHIS